MRDPAIITSVKFISVPTRDHDRALAFYTEKLGFLLITDQPFEQDRRWIEVAIGHSDTRLVLFTPPREEHRVGERFSGALACDDVEATRRQLTARGVKFESGPARQPWGTFAVMLDSAGNRFVLSSRS